MPAHTSHIRRRPIGRLVPAFLAAACLASFVVAVDVPAEHAQGSTQTVRPAR